MTSEKSLPLTALPALPGEKPENQALSGVKVIEQALLTMPQNPGVYRMINAEGQVLYVGKARNLKKRVKAYTGLNRLSERIRRMVFQTASLEIILTHSEAEALLLEANLIKKLKPRYNILLRDDKNYPWLFLGTDHAFPLLSGHRGAKLKKGRYFGPFASGQAVHETVHTLQRIFRLRTCSDNVFANRSRTCLLYQIKRCSAPCVGYISREDYALAVVETEAFLNGKTADLQKKLAAEMTEAAEALLYEKAAVLRDRIKALTQIQSKGVVNPTGLGDTDVIALYSTAGQTAIEVFFIRGGHNNGNRVFFPTHPTTASEDEVLSAFLAQFYSSVTPPSVLLLSHELSRQTLLTEALSLRADHKVVIECPQRGEKRAVTEHALLNAKEALERKLAENIGQQKLLLALKELLQLDRIPNRIEIYDNSHIMGQNAYGVMVVSTPEGLQKSAYRKFLIKSENLTPGDDFGMMREVLTRRFLRSLKEARKNLRETPQPEEKTETYSGTEQTFPDILLIDGGKGQVSAVRQVLTDLQLPEEILKNICLIGIAKGPDRNAGREWFYIEGREPFQLPPRDPVLFFLQRLRDEAHRFAITTHRAARNKTVRKSRLDDIPQIGAKRKKALLQHFGSAGAVSLASLSDLEAVKGISKDIAAGIHAYFHPDIRPLS